MQEINEWTNQTMKINLHEYKNTIIATLDLGDNSISSLERDIAKQFAQDMYQVSIQMLEAVCFDCRVPKVHTEKTWSDRLDIVIARLSHSDVMFDPTRFDGITFKRVANGDGTFDYEFYKEK